MTEPAIRVLVGKVGLDGHDVGARVVARALRDAGMEVIYTGTRQTPEGLVQVAVQEDVDALGISILSGAHMVFVPKILEGLRAAGAGGIPVFVGGVIPAEDIPELERLGVARVFLQGSTMAEVVTAVREAVRARRRAT
jgi:methylmalonyl-CoA mutase C-terminal domain/subunit